jgi:ribonuclease-3
VALGGRERLERALGYTFADPALFELALTHRSHGSRNNERLEFLGDAALGHVVAEWLFRAFPRASESELTLMRADLVRRATLAVVAREIDLGADVRLGSGERRSGGHRRESILADALEALLGAVLLDGGMDALRAVVARLFGAHLDKAGVDVRKDAKTLLQETLQARGLDLPKYEICGKSGDAHAPVFEVLCHVEGLGIAERAHGSSRREAEQGAARAALSALERSDER